jgi:crotonobetainyl-CoA:carnitine CoA-transferase CaiB-like acyl-CoA transferase
LLLRPYRVLDLTGPLGFLCGKTLADLGADVIKVEPPGGDPGRKCPPLLRLGSGEPQSLSWLAFNANKRGITLDLGNPLGQELFARLAKTSDFVLESFPPGKLDNTAITYGRLKQENPGLIWVSITPFGQEGPYQDYLASDLEIMALGGAISLAGEKDGEPMRVTVPQAPMWVGAEAAMGALTALAYRSITGKGQRVDVSAQAAVLAALAHAPTFWDLNRVNPERSGIFLTGRSVKGAKVRLFWPCKDGWINFSLYGGVAGRFANRQLAAWMEEKRADPGSLKNVEWDKFDVTALSQQDVDALEAPIGKFLAALTKREFYEGVIQREILGYPVSTVEDIFHDPQLAARKFWSELKDPASGATLRYPGGFARINGERLPIERLAPSVGQHNEDIYVKELGLSAAAFADLKANAVV